MQTLPQHILSILKRQPHSSLMQISIRLTEEGQPKKRGVIKSAIERMILNDRIGFTIDGLSIHTYFVVDHSHRTISQRLEELEQQITRAKRSEASAAENHRRAEFLVNHLLLQQDLLLEYQADEAKKLQGLQREVAA